MDNNNGGEEKKSISTLEKAVKKIQSLTNELTKKVKQAFDGLKGNTVSVINGIEAKVDKSIKNISNAISHPVKTSQKAAGKIFDNVKNSIIQAQKKMDDAVEKIKSNVGTMAKAVGSKMKEAGSGMIDFGTSAVKSANNLDKAMNQFMASTGKGAEETERYKKVMEGIYANNYGDSFENIGKAMYEVTKQLGDMDDESLRSVTESAFVLRDTFGYDIKESAKAAKAMMDRFGIDGEEAMNKIAAGAQNGLDFSGNLESALAGVKDAAYGTGEEMDKLKEVKYDDLDSTFEGLKRNIEVLTIPLGEQLIPLFSELIEELLPVIEEYLPPLIDMVAEWAESFMPLIEEVLPVLMELIQELSEAFMPIFEEILPVLMELIQELAEPLMQVISEILPVLVELIEELLPILESVIEFLTPILSIFIELLEPIIDLINEAIFPLIDAITQLLETAFGPLQDILIITAEVFSSKFEGMLKDAKDIIGAIVKVIGGLVDFITGVFTGNWKGAWQGLVDIVSGVFSALATIVKNPINGVIDIINGFIRGLNAIRIPEWVPIVGGCNLSIPEIPRLKVGMDYVPNDFFLAFLDEGEAVLTKQQNAQLRSLGGIEGIQATLGLARGMESCMEIPGIDYNRLEKIVMGANSPIYLTLDGQVLMSWLQDESGVYSARTGGMNIWGRR